MFTHPDLSRAIGLLAVVCLVPPMLFLPPLVVAISAGAVLTGIVIADNLRISTRTVSPPGPHRPTDPPTNDRLEPVSTDRTTLNTPRGDQPHLADDSYSRIGRHARNSKRRHLAALAT